MRTQLAVVLKVLAFGCWTVTACAQTPTPSPMPSPITSSAASPSPAAVPMPSPLYVVTYYELVPAGQPSPAGAQPAAIFSRYVAKAAAEPGAVSFRVLDDAERHSRYVVLEVWATGDSFSTHRQAESTLALKREIGGWQIGPSDQRVHGRMQ